VEARENIHGEQRDKKNGRRVFFGLRRCADVAATQNYGSLPADDLVAASFTTMAPSWALLGAAACAALASPGDAFALNPTVLVSARQGAAGPLRGAELRVGLRVVPRAVGVPRAARAPLQLRALFGMGGGKGKQKVGVIGATGGVGRLAVAYLLEQGYDVRAIVRSEESAAKLLPANIEVMLGDTRDPTFGAGLTEAIAGVDALIVATGTTAFPTDKWGPNQENTPQAVDEKGVKNVVAAIGEVNSKKGKKMGKIALLSSIGVERRTKFPFLLLNFYGVLDAKFAGERAVIEGAPAAGYSYALARLGRLVGGPYTGTPDVASLLQLDEGANQAIVMRKGDPEGFAGDLSRKQAAMALVQCIVNDRKDFSFAIANKPGPEPSQDDWDEAFASLDLEIPEKPTDFSFIIQDLLDKAAVTWDEAKAKVIASNNIVEFSSKDGEEMSVKIKGMLSEVGSKVLPPLAPQSPSLPSSFPRLSPVGLSAPRSYPSAPMLMLTEWFCFEKVQKSLAAAAAPSAETPSSPEESTRSKDP